MGRRRVGGFPNGGGSLMTEGELETPGGGGDARVPQIWGGALSDQSLLESEKALEFCCVTVLRKKADSGGGGVANWFSRLGWGRYLRWAYRDTGRS